MKKKAPKQSPSGLTFRNCTVTAPTFALDKTLADSVIAVANASAAHARALEKLADRIAGPENIGIKIEGNHA